MANGGRVEGSAPQSSPAKGNPNNKTQGGGDASEFGSLRQQVSDLTSQIQQHLAGPASNVLNSAGDAANEMMAGVSAKGREAVAGAQEVKDNFIGAIDNSLKNRPYTTLAMAFGIGFLISRLS